MDWRRIFLTVILFIVSIYFTSGGDSPTENCSGLFNCIKAPPITIGFPLRFINYPDFIYMNLLIDLIFYYIASYFLIFVWDRIRKKKAA